MHIYFEEDHHTFLLHVWKETPESEWRFILKNINTQDQRRFNNLEQLMLDLQAQFTERAGIDEAG